MSSKRDSIVPDVGNYPREDLVDLYTNLAASYGRVKDENELNKQEIHQIRSQLKILQRSQNDLQNELDGINESHKGEIDNILKSHSTVVEGLKSSKLEIEGDKLILETKIEELIREIEDQNEIIRDMRVKLSKSKPVARISDSFSINLEVEIESLKEKLMDVHGQLEEGIKENQDKEAQIEELNERVLCLEDNLESKRSEIEEKNDVIESLQEQLNEMTVEIALLKNAPEEASK